MTEQLLVGSVSERLARFRFRCNCGDRMRGEVAPAELVRGLRDIFLSQHRDKGHLAGGQIIYEETR